jgi:hypothetical protein
MQDLSSFIAVVLGPAAVGLLVAALVYWLKKRS